MVAEKPCDKRKNRLPVIVSKYAIKKYLHLAFFLLLLTIYIYNNMTISMSTEYEYIHIICGMSNLQYGIFLYFFHVWPYIALRCIHTIILLRLR